MNLQDWVGMAINSSGVSLWILIAIGFLLLIMAMFYFRVTGPEALLLFVIVAGSLFFMSASVVFQSSFAFSLLVVGVILVILIWTRFAGG